MKKIFALVLALTLVFALASCGGKKGGDNSADLEPFKTAISATSLDNAVVQITASNDFVSEPLVASYYIVYGDDGSAEIDFTYELYNEISEDGKQEIKTTYSGYASVAADGTVSGNSDKVSGTVTSAASVGFNLDASKMTFSASMGILTANVSSANTEAVLGSSIGADVVLTISVANGAVTGATISYTLNGVDYEIVCTYNG